MALILNVELVVDSAVTKANGSLFIWLVIELTIVLIDSVPVTEIKL